MPSSGDDFDPDDPREQTRQVVVTTATFAKGEVLAGKYRIEKVLGRGGMGHVFAAMHIDLDQTVAIKVMHRELLADTSAVARFGREAKAAAAMQGSHTARIFDVGKLDSGQPYMVMEHLEGRDLQTLMDTGARLAIPDALEWMTQACEAVAEAHDLGIVHRDIKPANLFLTRDRGGKPVIKVLDFGLAKAIASERGRSLKESMSSDGMVGSPFWMSPEQARGQKVDGRTDVWSLGATLYTLVAGVPPFNGPSISEVSAALLMDEFPPITTHRPDAPPDLETLLRGCMTKDVRHRLATVRDMLEALRALQSGRPVLPSVSDLKGTVRMNPPSQPSFSVKGTVPMITGQGQGANPRGQAPTVRKKSKGPPRAFWWALSFGFLIATAAIVAVAFYLSR